MFQQPPPPSSQSVQFQSPRKDGRAVVRETSTYMSDADAQQFCEFFAEGLDSGLGYARIIGFLERKGTKANVIRSLRKALLEEGAQLSEAFARYGLLDAPGRKLVLVAETQGTLPELLKIQAKSYRDRYERKKDLVFGAIEPMVMAIFAFGALMPVVSNITMLAESRNGLVSDVFGLILGPTIVSIFALLLYFLLGYTWLSLPVDMPLRESVGRFMLRIPGVSIPGRLFSMSVFCRYFHTSVRSGLNVYEGLYLAAEASNNPAILSKIKLALDRLEQGYSLEQSLTVVKAIPRDVIDYVGMGEETGRLEEMLVKCSGIYRERADKAFQQSIAALIWIFRIGLLFGVLIVAFAGLLDKVSIFTDVMGGM